MLRVCGNIWANTTFSRNCCNWSLSIWIAITFFFLLIVNFWMHIFCSFVAGHLLRLVLVELLDLFVGVDSLGLIGKWTWILILLSLLHLVLGVLELLEPWILSTQGGLVDLGVDRLTLIHQVWKICFSWALNRLWPILLLGWLAVFIWVMRMG